jgi:cell division septum initiation protein DivIVA
MDTILIILGVIAVSTGVIVYFVKKGKIADRDGDLIPDVVEDAVENAKKTAKVVKTKAKRVAEEAKDVADVVKGKARKGKKPASKKVTKAHLRTLDVVELIEMAQKDLGVTFDENATKTNIINKLYELYNKK